MRVRVPLDSEKEKVQLLQECGSGARQEKGWLRPNLMTDKCRLMSRGPSLKGKFT